MAKKKKLGKVGPVAEKKVIPVETDATKLVNYVCGSNIMKTGEDIKVRKGIKSLSGTEYSIPIYFQIKPDSEYPDWLWELPLGGPKPLDELDPESKQYWRRLRRSALSRNNKMMKLKKF